MSTKWAWGAYRRTFRDHSEHWRVREVLQARVSKVVRINAELKKENEQLRAKLKALHQMQFKTNMKKGEKEEGGPGEDGVKKNNRKRGAPKGHPGWFRRKPDYTGQTVHVPAPTECPHCSSSELIPVEQSRDHLQEDIVLQPRNRVTNFKHAKYFVRNATKI